MLRAKFKVQRIGRYEGSDPSETVHLMAVYSADPESENAQWSKATPSGTLSMTISNPKAQGLLEEGKEYYIDITPADQ